MMIAEERLSDVKEWRELLKFAKRPGVIRYINDIIGRIESNQDDIDEGEHVPPEPPMAAAKLLDPPSCIISTPIPIGVTEVAVAYAPLKKFSWYQDEDYVKIIIEIPGLRKDCITVQFSSISVEFKVTHMPGVQNSRLYICPLEGEIEPSRSRMRIQSKQTSITLKKKNFKKWGCLQAKPNSTKPAAMPDNADPGATMINLMKDLYDKGDDDMKRTIKKAWVESQEKKSGREGSTLDFGL